MNTHPFTQISFLANTSSKDYPTIHDELWELRRQYQSANTLIPRNMLDMATQLVGDQTISISVTTQDAEAAMAFAQKARETWLKHHPEHPYAVTRLCVDPLLTCSILLPDKNEYDARTACLLKEGFTLWTDEPGIKHVLTSKSLERFGNQSQQAIVARIGSLLRAEKIAFAKIELELLPEQRGLINHWSFEILHSHQMDKENTLYAASLAEPRRKMTKPI